MRHPGEFKARLTMDPCIAAACSLFRALHDHRVRYLVAGGLAVVAHGYVRFTADVNLVLEMDARNLRAAVDAFRALGYRPRAPVSLDDFLDPAIRAEWVRDEGMTVFSLYGPAHVATEVDVFVDMRERSPSVTPGLRVSQRRCSASRDLRCGLPHDALRPPAP